MEAAEERAHAEAHRHENLRKALDEQNYDNEGLRRTVSSKVDEIERLLGEIECMRGQLGTNAD